MNANEETDVLIVGGGLAGLATALFLAWHGVDCLMVERHGGTSTHPRARGINPRTMELLRSVGVEDQVRSTVSARALAGNAGVMAVETLNGKELGRLQQAYHMDPGADFSALTPTPWCMCHQDEFEPVLRARAEELGARIVYDTRVRDIHDTGDEVGAVLHGPSGTREVRARYLVAADGASSPIRSSLGIPFEGIGTLGHYMNIHFEADLRAELGDRRFVLCYTINPQVRGALLPIDNAHRWLLHVPFDAERPGDADFGDERCVKLVRAAVGRDDLDVKLLGALGWESAGRTAGRFREGRTFLVGDAAHVMPPSGAYGSNVGIQDAHNLAWKLAAVLNGHADDSLLDSYDTERRPVAAATVEQAVLRSKDRPRLAQGRPAPPNPAIMPDPVVMFGGRYDAESVWEPRPSGRPGTRAPHLPTKEGSLLDLYGKTMVLVAGTDGAGWGERAGRAARELGVPLTCHRVGSGPLAGLGSEWASAHGTGDSGVVLVRPDGYVAWRSPNDAGPEAGEQIKHALRETLAPSAALS